MKFEMKRPYNVSKHFQEAQEFALNLASIVHLTSAILDDWNTGSYSDSEAVISARIVYGSDKVKYCRSAKHETCQACLIYQKVGGADNHDKKLFFRATLCKASVDQIAIFSSPQFYLNCKTFEQYQEDYIRWFLKKCHTKESLEQEVEWVKGFRILMLQQVSLNELEQMEQRSKRYIINTVIKRMQNRGDFERAHIIQSYAAKKGII